MAGRFRFTPKCCCGVKEECTPPCIPQCREIFRGTLNYSAKLRDTVPTPAYTDNLYIQTNLLNSYNAKSGSCSYFDVVEDSGLFYAVPTASVSNGNHILGLIRYRISTDPFETTVLTRSENAPFIPLADSFITVRTYDSMRHTDGSLTWYRVFCLPFDNKTEPLCFNNNTSVELRDNVESVRDYYIHITGDPRYGCTFTWATNCGNGGNLTPTVYQSAQGLKTRIEATAGSWQTPALDYQTIRLFGFTPMAEIANGLFEGTSISKEFVVSYAQTSSGTIVPVVLSDTSVDDFTLTATSFDEDFNKTGHPDYPLEIFDWTGDTYATAVDARIIFGSSDTSAFDGTQSTGSSALLPNLWITPRETQLPHNAATLNNQRYNGIWWALAARSPCGVPFPETVTTGILYSVPVGLFSFPTNAWSTSHRVQMTGVFTSAPLTLEKTNESMSYTELHQGVTRRNQYDSNFEYYIDVNWRGSDIGWTRPYIVKPVGKRLKRLIWRVFRNPLALIGTTIPPSSYSDIVTAQRIDCDTFSDLNSDPSNRPVPAKWAGYKVNVGGFNIVFPYPVNAAHYKPDQGDFVPTNQYTDSRGYVTNYAYDNGIIECEYSVNGDSFKTITPNDDPTGELTDTLYIPTLSRDKIIQLFGGSLSGLKTISMGPDANFATDYFTSPILMATHFDFDYIAVWEDD